MPALPSQTPPQALPGDVGDIHRSPRFLDGLFTSEHEEVVAVCGPLLLTHQRESGASQQQRTLRLWVLQALAEEETSRALATMRTTVASMGSRMSLGSRNSYGSGGGYGQGHEVAGLGVGAFAHPRSKSPNFALRGSPVTVSSPAPYSWDNAAGGSSDRGGSPIAGLQNALGLDGDGR